jgi:hypothetical protein
MLKKGSSPMIYSPETLIKHLETKGIRFENFVKTKRTLEVWGENIGIFTKNFLNDCGFKIITNHFYPEEWVCLGPNGKLIYGNSIYCKIKRTIS